jgi:hypothetical protein
MIFITGTSLERQSTVRVINLLEVLLGILRLGIAVVLVATLLIILALLAGQQLNAVSLDLPVDTVIIVLILPLTAGQRTTDRYDVTLVTILAQVLRALSPCNEVDEITGILGGRSSNCQG